MSRAVAAIAAAFLLSACGAGGTGQTASSQDTSQEPQRETSLPPSATATPAPTEATAEEARNAGDAADAPGERSGKGKPAPRKGKVIIAADSQFGPMLYDGTGQAIYLFDKETSPTPRCYGPCAAAWPPVLTKGEPRARDGADQALLGTVRRRDGSTQVTYDGQPLYFYAHEGKYQVLCHDIREFGGLWLVVTPEGPAAPPNA